METKHWVVSQKTAKDSAKWQGPYPTLQAKAIQKGFQTKGYFKVTLVVMNTITHLGGTS